MEESNNCLDLRRWRGRGELGAKVENEGRTVLTWKSSMAERGVGCLRGLERRDVRLRTLVVYIRLLEIIK